MTKSIMKYQRGVTLIEVLVTVLIMSIGLLGLAALQAFSLQVNQGAYQRTQATNLAYEIGDFLKLNRDRTAYILSHGSADNEYQRMVSWAEENLPGGAVEIDTSNAPLMIVTVSWQDARMGDQPEDGETVVFPVRI